MIWYRRFVFDSGHGCGVRWNWSRQHQSRRETNQFCLFAGEHVWGQRFGALHGITRWGHAAGTPIPCEACGSLVYSSLHCLSLGPAKARGSSDLDKVSLLHQQHEHPVHAQSGKVFPVLPRCALNLMAVEHALCSARSAGQGKEWREWIFTI